MIEIIEDKKHETFAIKQAKYLNGLDIYVIVLFNFKLFKPFFNPIFYLMKMKGTSLDPTNEKLKQLKQLLPEAFAESKLDWEKLKATLGEDITFADERYVLNWAGKSNAFREIQMPTTKTLAPCKKESVDWDHTEHIFIEGETWMC